MIVHIWNTVGLISKNVIRVINRKYSYWNSLMRDRLKTFTLCDGCPSTSIWREWRESLTKFQAEILLSPNLEPHSHFGPKLFWIFCARTSVRVSGRGGEFHCAGHWRGPFSLNDWFFSMSHEPCAKTMLFTPEGPPWLKNNRKNALGFLVHFFPFYGSSDGKYLKRWNFETL